MEFRKIHKYYFEKSVLNSFIWNVLVSWVLVSTDSARADLQTVTQKLLQEFSENPKQFMMSQQSVQKYELKYQVKTDRFTGERVSEELISETPITDSSEFKFLSQDIQSGEFVDQKNFRHEGKALVGEAVSTWRERLIEGGRAEIDRSVDDPATLVGEGLALSTLEQMERFRGKSYRSVTLSNSPWSGDYWAIFTGVTAKRYNDPQFMDLFENKDWSLFKNYLTAQRPFEALDSASIARLSPSEKYDLLVGDADMTLTKAMLAQGEKYYSPSSPVPTWMGICHGWAPASYLERRPKHDVEVMAADGKTKIVFHPSDIKALASLLWAQTKNPARFIGTRCNIKDPETDENGRILDPSCFDTNPGTWHQAVVNQLGYYKKSFVLDATYDYEVWNQPAFGYEYTYFNPKTKRQVDSLEDATVVLDQEVTGSDGKSHKTFQGDLFSNYRSATARSIVGIAMKFIYIAETAPTTESHDKADLDRRVAVHYLYDLELGQDDKIIGGEWYHKQHPDFLWSPSYDAHALSRGDSVLNGNVDRSHWKKRHARSVPAAWRQSAIQESSPAGQPLTRIVKELIQKSNQIDVLGFHLNLPGTGIKERF